MGKRCNRIVLCLVVAFLAAAAVGSRAEVSAETQQGVILLMLGITEGPDPIPQVQWTPVLRPPSAAVLNQDGWLRDDGRPDIGSYYRDGKLVRREASSEQLLERWSSERGS